MRSTTAPYTESRLTRSVANERVGFPVVEHLQSCFEVVKVSPHVQYIGAFHLVQTAAGRSNYLGADISEHVK